MNTWFIKTVKRWLPWVFLSTCICGLVYAAVQQSYRQSANDPQIEMAEDAATAIETAMATPALVPSGTVDIGTSLAPYIVFYDSDGNPTGGNGQLNGQLPTLPAGVFASASTTGEERVTWQPEPGVRSAIVVVAIRGPEPGFVMAGRSLREVEARENSLELMTDAIWIFTLIGTFIAVSLSPL